MKITCCFQRYDWSPLFPFKQIIGCTRKLFSLLCVCEGGGTATTLQYTPIFSSQCSHTFINIGVFMCSVNVTYARYLLIHYLSYTLLFSTILAISPHALVLHTSRDFYSATHCGQDRYMVLFSCVLSLFEKQI